MPHTNFGTFSTPDSWASSHLLIPFVLDPGWSFWVLKDNFADGLIVLFPYFSPLYTPRSAGDGTHNPWCPSLARSAAEITDNFFSETKTRWQQVRIGLIPLKSQNTDFLFSTFAAKLESEWNCNKEISTFSSPRKSREGLEEQTKKEDELPTTLLPRDRQNRNSSFFLPISLSLSVFHKISLRPRPKPCRFVCICGWLCPAKISVPKLASMPRRTKGGWSEGDRSGGESGFLAGLTLSEPREDWTTTPFLPMNWGNEACPLNCRNARWFRGKEASVLPWIEAKLPPGSHPLMTRNYRRLAPLQKGITLFWATTLKW